MRELFEHICARNYLEVPKRRYPREKLAFIVGDISGETAQSWLVACSHKVHAPATATEIREAESALGFEIPWQYAELLSLSNGAELFSVERVCLPELGNPPYVRHRILGCSDLVSLNQNMLTMFRRAYANDPEFSESVKLNYLAFCDAGDGNYQSLLQNDGRVFMLFNELLSRPYSEQDADWYYTISDSFASWLNLIASTGGWGGRGSVDSGL